MDNSPKFSYLVQPPNAQSPKSESTNPPSPVSKPIGLNTLFGVGATPTSPLGLNSSNDYECIRGGGGATKTIAGSKVNQGGAGIRKLKLKNTLNEVKVTDESSNRGITPNALGTFVNNTFRGSPRVT